MSWTGATANRWQMNDVSDRLRMLLQAKVYLRTDLSAGVTTCTIGQDGADRGGVGYDIPSQFFNGFINDLPLDALLEKQETDGSDTVETENVSITGMPAFGAAANYGLQVTLASGPSKDYTTALNSRIGLRTHPVTGSTFPPVVMQGYLDLSFGAEVPMVGPWNFPCLCVSLDEVGQDEERGGNVLYAETYTFTCTWIRQITTNEDIDSQLMDDAMIFLQMLDGDNYIGGGTDMSEPIPPVFEPDAELREGIRMEKKLDVVHFGVICTRGELRNMHD